MQNYKDYILMSDLDGTLLTTEKVISEENKRALKVFTQNGGQFGIATGRVPGSVEHYLEDLGINLPSILYNGGAIYDTRTKSFLKCYFLTKEILKEILEKLGTENETLSIHVYTTEGMFIANPNKRIYKELIGEKQKYSFREVAGLMDKDWIKIILNDEHENLLKYKKLLDPLEAERKIRTVFSESYYLEILPFEVSKGSALQELLAIIKEEKKTVIAIGDYNNDIEMLKIADIGVAPNNAREEVKQVADEVTVSNDEHAIANIIFDIIPNLKHHLDKKDSFIKLDV